MRNFKLTNLNQYLHTLIVIYRYASRPTKVLIYYLMSKKPKPIKTRSGLIIKTSSNPHDIIKFVFVACKRDYGEILPGSTVVDV